jgi:hypothetical protein
MWRLYENRFLHLSRRTGATGAAEAVEQSLPSADKPSMSGLCVNAHGFSLYATGALWRRSAQSTRTPVPLNHPSVDSQQNHRRRAKTRLMKRRTLLKALLEVAPVAPDPMTPALVFSYDISFGVRDGDDTFKAELQDILDRRQRDIEAILIDYGISLVKATPRTSLQRRHKPSGSIALLEH